VGRDGQKEARYQRHLRVRLKVAGTTQRPRLCVFRSLKHIYVQIVDDSCGRTLAAASTLDAELREGLREKKKTDESKLAGSLVAKRALERGLKQVVFDRGGYKYQGRVKALAEAAREAGLRF
jgi:large subunit ribosomal protein L18